MPLQYRKFYLKYEVRRKINHLIYSTAPRLSEVRGVICEFKIRACDLGQCSDTWNIFQYWIVLGPRLTVWQLLSLIARFMGPTWGPSGADRTQMGPMFAPWISLSEIAMVNHIMLGRFFNKPFLHWNNSLRHCFFFTSMCLKNYANRICYCSCGKILLLGETKYTFFWV